MTEISPAHASHKLNVAPSAKPVRQKVRHFHPDRHLVIQTEVDNLLHNGFIRAVKYPEWLANVVVVPKKGNKWRVCVDYTGLNDAYPKDSFPLPPHILDCGCLGRAWYAIIPGCFLRIPPDPHAPSGRGKNVFHHSPRTLLL